LLSRGSPLPRVARDGAAESGAAGRRVGRRAARTTTAAVGARCCCVRAGTKSLQGSRCSNPRRLERWRLHAVAYSEERRGCRRGMSAGQRGRERGWKSPARLGRQIRAMRAAARLPRRRRFKLKRRRQSASQAERHRVQRAESEETHRPSSGPTSLCRQGCACCGDRRRPCRGGSGSAGSCTSGCRRVAGSRARLLFLFCYYISRVSILLRIRAVAR